MDILLKVLNMGGYGFYVWSSYGAVIFILGLQLLRPWRRWRKIKETLHAE